MWLTTWFLGCYLTLGDSTRSFGRHSAWMWACLYYCFGSNDNCHCWTLTLVRSVSQNHSFAFHTVCILQKDWGSRICSSEGWLLGAHGLSIPKVNPLDDGQRFLPLPLLAPVRLIASRLVTIGVNWLLNGAWNSWLNCYVIIIRDSCKERIVLKAMMRLRHSHSGFSLHKLTELAQILRVADRGLIAFQSIDVIVFTVAISRLTTRGRVRAHAARSCRLVVWILQLLMLLRLLLDFNAVGNDALPGADPDPFFFSSHHSLRSLTNFNSAEIAVKVIATITIDHIKVVISLIGSHDLHKAMKKSVNWIRHS